MPAVGSSRSSSRGLASTTEARSTTRRVPVDSSAVRWWRNRSSPKAAITRFTASSLRRSVRRAQGRRRVVESTATSWRASSLRSRTSSTVNSGNRRQSWNERTMPTARRSSGRYSPRSMSSRRTLPACGATSPEITSSVVVLPDPLAPINPTMEPGSASKVTPLRACTPPNCTCKPSTSRRAGCLVDTATSATTVTTRPLPPPAQGWRAVRCAASPTAPGRSGCPG